MNYKLALTIVLSLSAVAFAYTGFGQKRQTTKKVIKETRMFQGVRTVIYHVDDLQKAKQWYSDMLGVKPYFDEPFYVGFNVGGYELGLDPDMEGVSKGTNVAAYWGVKDARAAYRRALELGATKHTEPREVGDRIITAVVVDPFDNLFGIIENPHFKAESGEG